MGDLRIPNMLLFSQVPFFAVRTTGFMSDTQKVNVTEIKMTHHLCSEALIVVVFLRR